MFCRVDRPANQDPLHLEARFDYTTPRAEIHYKLGITKRAGKSSLVEPAMPRARREFLSGDERAKSGSPLGGNALNEGFLGTAAPATPM